MKPSQFAGLFLLATALFSQASNAGQVIALSDGQTYPLPTGDVIMCGLPAATTPSVIQCSFTAGYGGHGDQSTDVCVAFNSACRALGNLAPGPAGPRQYCTTFINCADQNGQSVDSSACN